ncbi:hypothetical protein F5Y13DRAFT_174980 [Hypoxylon sp. FL1857]|nr:hypothetical protein F5Y13DRAFT_174980 [Hypoxylon sp. FL1857]
MINSWKKLSDCIVAGYAHFWSTYHGECTTEAEDPDRENAKGTDEKTKFSNQGYIDSCTNMVRQQLIDLGRFQDAERLEFQKHDLDVRDYLCLLSTVVADRTTEMNTCIHNAVSNTDQIRRKLKKRRSKHHYWKRHREIDFGGCGYGYRGLAGGRSSPLRFVTNIEDLEDEPTGMEVNKEPCEGLWGGEEENAQMEFQVVWSKDDAESEWG